MPELQDVDDARAVLWNDREDYWAIRAEFRMAYERGHVPMHLFHDFMKAKANFLLAGAHFAKVNEAWKKADPAQRDGRILHPREL